MSASLVGSEMCIRDRMSPYGRRGTLGGATARLGSISRRVRMATSGSTSGPGLAEKVQAGGAWPALRGERARLNAAR
eukprot:3221881-Alexandrium_andersonii.AAC.1